MAKTILIVLAIVLPIIITLIVLLIRKGVKKEQKRIEEEYSSLGFKPYKKIVEETYDKENKVK